jgi:hypothetical protein
MKSNESLRKEEGRKKLKTYDFAYLVKKNNESLRKEEATKKKTENKKVQIDRATTVLANSTCCRVSDRNSGGI